MDLSKKLMLCVLSEQIDILELNELITQGADPNIFVDQITIKEFNDVGLCEKDDKQRHKEPFPKLNEEILTTCVNFDADMLPLLVTVLRKHVKATSSLLHAGADINMMQANCRTVVETAMIQADTKMLKLLLQYKPKLTFYSGKVVGFIQYPFQSKIVRFISILGFLITGNCKITTPLITNKQTKTLHW